MGESIAAAEADMSNNISGSGGTLLPSLGLQPALLHPSLLRLASFVAPTATLPRNVDLRSQFPPVYDQGQLGSCTANATCAAVQFLLPYFMGSRLFLYYQERVLLNQVAVDYGGYLHDCVSVLENTGIAAETDWPYVISQFAVAPPAAAYAAAPSHKVLQSINIPVDTQQLKGCLAAGYPWVFGIALYTSFFNNTACCYGSTVNGVFVKPTGIVTIPAPGEAIYGYHAICAVGYDDDNEWWVIRNSWGTGIGDNGHFYFPYEYLTAQYMASDIWTIRTITSGPAVDCKVGSWSLPTACSPSTCGSSGTQTMTRGLTQPTDGGAACPSPTQTVPCQNAACATPTDCVVGTWSAPGVCSVTACGSSGTQVMTRTLTQPTNGGLACPSPTQTQLCETAACEPTRSDCTVGPWSDYSVCNAAQCGVRGEQTSSRIVLNPPSGTGMPCPALLQSQYCRITTCTESPCSVGPWSPWSDCSSQECGTAGTQIASRQVTQDGPQCPALTQTRPCNQHCGHNAQAALITLGAAVLLVPLISMVVLIL